MKLLSKLQVVGHRSYEPSFKVEFKGGRNGLDGAVDLALGGRPGEYLLGNCKAYAPLAGVEVILHIEEDGNHRVVSTLQKQEYNGVFRPNFGLLEKAGFKVTDAGNKQFAHIRSSRLPQDTVIRYSSIPTASAELSYELNPNGLRREEVAASMQGYAKALELIVRGIVKKAQPQTLCLGPGEEISRVVTEAERLDAEFRKRMQRGCE